MLHKIATYGGPTQGWLLSNFRLRENYKRPLIIGVATSLLVCAIQPLSQLSLVYNVAIVALSLAISCLFRSKPVSFPIEVRKPKNDKVLEELQTLIEKQKCKQKELAASILQHETSQASFIQNANAYRALQLETNGWDLAQLQSKKETLEKTIAEKKYKVHILEQLEKTESGYLQSDYQQQAKLQKQLQLIKECNEAKRRLEEIDDPLFADEPENVKGLEPIANLLESSLGSAREIEKATLEKLVAHLEQELTSYPKMDEKEIQDQLAACVKAIQAVKDRNLPNLKQTLAEDKKALETVENQLTYLALCQKKQPDYLKFCEFEGKLNRLRRELKKVEDSLEEASTQARRRQPF